MLSLVLIVLGLVFKRLHLSARGGLVLAWTLALSTALFPLGVVMQIGPAAALGKVLSTAGSIGVILGLVVAVVCLLRGENNGKVIVGVKA